MPSWCKVLTQGKLGLSFYSKYIDNEKNFVANASAENIPLE